jgi:hypothetical protein
MFNGHNGELFWSSEMSHPERSPQDNVLVLDRGVFVNPFGKTQVITSWVLVNMDPRRKDLLLGVGRDEHLMDVAGISWTFFSTEAPFAYSRCDAPKELVSTPSIPSGIAEVAFECRLECRMMRDQFLLPVAFPPPIDLTHLVANISSAVSILFVWILDSPYSSCSTIIIRNGLLGGLV